MNAQNSKGDCQQKTGTAHRKQRPQHVWMDAAATFCDREASGLMQRIPPFDRKFNDWNVDDTNQKQDGAHTQGKRLVVKCVNQGNISYILKKQYEHSC